METVTTINETDIHLRIAYSHVLPLKYFLFWRVFVITYFGSIWLVCFLILGYQIIYFFTTWTLAVGFLYHAFGFYATYLHYKKENGNMNPNLHKECVRFCSFASFWQMIAPSTAITVVIIFWAVIAPLAGLLEVWFNDGIQIQVHGVTMIFTIIDFYICCNTIMFKNTWWKLVLYGLVYILWSIIFVFVTGLPLYPVLDWKHDFVFSLISGVFIVGMTIFFHGILCWTNNKLIHRRAPYADDVVRIDTEPNENELELVQK